MLVHYKKESNMALTKDRIGEIAVQALQRQMEQNGNISLNPKEVKRQIANEAKSLGISPRDMAEFAKVVYKTAYDKVMAELDTIK
jgi:hypothetical protein